MFEGIDVIEAMNGDRTEGSEGESESEVENEGDMDDVDDNDDIAGEMCVFKDDEEDEEDGNETNVGEVVLMSWDCPCIWTPRTFIAWSYS